MKDLSWVKFPSNQQQRMAWRKLLRRKDSFELTRNSRLCSRHFDRTDILPNGTSKSPPKYFFWNNFGLDVDQAREERNDRAARRASHVHVPAGIPRPQVPGPNSSGSLLEVECCPEIGSEVSVDTVTRVAKRKRDELVGRKYSLDPLTIIMTT